MTDNEKFKKWMNTIPYGDYSEVRDRVIKECKIPSTTYGNWRNTPCSIPPLAKDIIITIAGWDIFNDDLWTLREKQKADEQETPQVVPR